MNYGLYISTAGALSAMHRQDVLANNLANVNTVGFKPDAVDLRQRLPERSEALAGSFSPQLLLEKLGGGQFVEPARTRFAQGQLLHTGNDLDVAIKGDAFFVIDSEKGSGAERLRFTRDGRFALNAANELVTAVSGMRIMDANDRPIRLRPGAPIRIDPNGRIFQDDRPVSRIRIATIADSRELLKVGNNLFALKRGATLPNVGSPISGAAYDVYLEQGSIELSAVDPIITLNELINTTRAVQANTKMIQFHDNLMDQAINRFARVA